jgi:hypothetical protein
VEHDWLERGALIELEVPRNLRCAGCQGGGCDLCDRSGAVTLRGRNEPPEMIQVTLPKRGGTLPDNGSFTIRIPEQGGLPRSSTEVRGFLLLTVARGDKADTGVRLLEAPRPMPVQMPASVPVPSPRAIEPAQPESGVRPVRRRTAAVPIAIALVVVLWVAFLVYLRVSGRG